MITALMAVCVLPACSGDDTGATDQAASGAQEGATGGATEADGEDSGSKVTAQDCTDSCEHLLEICDDVFPTVVQCATECEEDDTTQETIDCVVAADLCDDVMDCTPQ